MLAFTFDCTWFFYSICNLLSQFINWIKWLLTIFSLRVGKLGLHATILTKRAISATSNYCCMHLLSNLSCLLLALSPVPRLHLSWVNWLGLVSRAHIRRSLSVHHCGNRVICLILFWGKFSGWSIPTEWVNWWRACVSGLDVLSSARLLINSMTAVKFSPVGILNKRFNCRLFLVLNCYGSDS